jgi:cell volume regulation protein A
MNALDEILLLSAFIIFVGYIGEIIFRKTHIPSFLVLVFIGFLLGPVLGIISKATLMPIIGVLAQITLLMVIFHGGIDLKITPILREGWRAFLQVALYVGISFILITLFSWLILKFTLLSSLIFASIIGGETTAVVIIPLSRQLGLKQSTIVFLTFEAALNSIVLVILFTTFTNFYQLGIANAYNTIYSIVSSFSIGLFVGFVLAVFWIYLMNELKTQPYTYVLTIGLLFLTFALADVVGGSGYLATIVFGIVFGNYDFVSSLLKRKVNINALKHEIFEFHGEITFLLKTFFFVFMGLILSISFNSLVVGLTVGGILTLLLLVSRVFAVSISTYKSSLISDKKKIISSMAEGVTPITLSVLALEQGVPHANAILLYVTYVVIFTNLITTIGIFILMRKEAKTKRKVFNQ